VSSDAIVFVWFSPPGRFIERDRNSAIVEENIMYARKQRSSGAKDAIRGEETTTVVFSTDEQVVSEGGSPYRLSIVNELEHHRVSIVDETVRLIAELFPEFIFNHPETDYRRYGIDVDRHVAMLERALRLAKPKLFVTYTRWFVSTKAGQDHIISDVINTYRILGEVIAQKLGNEKGRIVKEYLRLGERALLQM